MKRTGLFLVFLAIGLQVFLIGGYLKIWPEDVRTVIKIANALFLALITYFCYRNDRLKPYSPVLLAFAFSAAGLMLAWLLRDWPLALLQPDLATPQGWAIAKIYEALPMVLPVLVLLPFFGRSYASLFLQRGRFWLSLLLGLGICLLVVLMYGLTSDVGPKIQSMVPFAGWLLAFSIANSFLEELLLRGLFLRPFEKFFPPFAALLLSTLIFTAMHFGASYLTSDNLLMLLGYIFLLGLGNGAIMQRTDSIWGAVLAHTVADVLLLVSIFGTV